MSQHPVPPPLLILIGDMTVSFARLELMMKGLFGSLIREHQRLGQILSAELSFSRLIDAIISLYQDRHGIDDDFKLLRGLLTRAGVIEEERNSITHSFWGASATPGAITRVKITSRRKQGYHVQFEEYDAIKLKAVVDEIKTLDDEIGKFHWEFIKKGKVINNPFKRMW